MKPQDRTHEPAGTGVAGSSEYPSSEQTRDYAQSHQEPSTQANPGNDANPAKPAATQPGEARQLDDRHLQYLEQRAVPRAFAQQCGLYSLSAADVTTALGLKEPVECGGLAIEYPYRDDTHPYVRVRLDDPEDDGPRFLCPAGVAVPIYIANEAVFDAAMPLFVTEGPIKSLALANLGHASVGLGGVNTTHRKDDENGRALGPSWKKVPIAGREVFIVFDAGVVKNPLVAEAEGSLARALRQAEAVVRLVRIPLRTAGLTRKAVGVLP